MYKCEVTNRTSRPGEKLNRIAIVTRSKQYKHFDRETEEEWFSHGFETVKEINANEEGAQLWNSWNDEQRRTWLVAAGHVRPE